MGRPNFEKVIYAKLLRFREEQLENYQGPPFEYSVSDYHHGPRQTVRNPSTRVSLQNQELGSRRRVSQYSILDENNLSRSNINQRKPSVAGTEQSYDPFRTSRNQITKIQAAQAEHARTIVLRRLSRSHRQGQSNTSLNRHATSKKSFRNPALARVQQADAYSIASSPSPVPGSSRSRLTPSINERSISQCGSRRSMSSRMPARTSMSYKRGVSFAHMRRRSISAHHLRSTKQKDASPLTLQQRYLHEDPEPASSSPQYLPAGDSPQTVPPTIRSRKNPARSSEEVAARKANAASAYWKDDTRIISSELEKVCDEAFNRASIASTVLTSAFTEPLDQSYDSPATSMGALEDLGNSSNAYRAPRRNEIDDSYLNRPLPLPPSFGHLGSFTYRELARTRALLKERAADRNMNMAPGYFDEVIAHLDRLMQPSTTKVNEQDRRAVSTPDKPTRQPSKDEFEMLLARGPFSLRSTSEPASKGSRKDGKERATVRIVDPNPISPTKPLTIRKKSRSSTLSAESDQRQRLQDQWRSEDVRSCDRLQGERRSAGLSLLESSLEPIEEDDKETRDYRSWKTLSGEGKRRGWFRRHEPVDRSQDTDRGPPPPQKDEALSQHQETRDKSRKRASDAPSDESRGSETRKASSAKEKFLKIFSKREPKDSKGSGDGGESTVRPNAIE